MEEIVQEGSTGLLFSDSDPQDLAAKAMEMASDENKYAQLCANARLVYDLKYTPVRYYEKLMNIYHSILS
jgi:glycosyltransferase involved in cell wall biosynthesis